MRSLRLALTWAAALALALAAACGGGGDDGAGPDLDAYPYPVQHVEEIVDRSHFAVGQVYDLYNSNPPTSGPHAGSFAPWGVSELAVAKEMAVHNMEHGGAVVWYNCNAAPRLETDACAELRNALSRVVSGALADGKSVLMTPYTGMDSHIALTAWAYLDTFGEFDEARVRMFIDTFECNFDPEGFC